jgi:glyoxylase-like metal-dependent hydrolase (beta-lactamase superfamily II)
MGHIPDQLAGGLWRWTARHPEWHPGEFGREVASFAVDTDGALLLVDPLLPPEPGPVLELVEGLLGERLAILITIPYHVRSSEELWRRFGDRTDCSIWGHRACRKRLRSRAGFHEIELGVPLPGGVSALAIGRPRRQETPFYLPSHRALVFGDAVAEVDGELRVWATDRVDDRRARWYRERFNPTLEPLLELDFDRVLVTHGEPVVSGGRAALRAALDARPWYRRG